MAENMRKNIYLKLLCFDIIFFTINGLLVSSTKYMGNDGSGGYGPIVSSLTCLIVILMFLGKEKITINFCFLYCSLSCCSAFITMMISKVKKHFASSNKENDEDQINKPDGDSTVTPIVSKVNEITSNENKESSSSKSTE